jgi:hypothetical protein
MSSTRIIIIGIALVLVLVGGIVFTLFRSAPDAEGPLGPSFPQSGERPETPGPDTSGEEITLVLQDGSTVEVSNFTQEASTKADPQNPGFYLVGQGSGTRDASFDITYMAATDFFNVSLMQAPLRDARRRAEIYLMSTLGLDEKDMCALRYNVATPAFVDESYAGTDLRFSFCSDAVQL